jgi:hypothetical protein
MDIPGLLNRNTYKLLNGHFRIFCKVADQLFFKGWFGFQKLVGFKGSSGFKGRLVWILDQLVFSGYRIRLSLNWYKETTCGAFIL